MPDLGARDGFRGLQSSGSWESKAPGFRFLNRAPMLELRAVAASAPAQPCKDRIMTSEAKPSICILSLSHHSKGIASLGSTRLALTRLCFGVLETVERALSSETNPKIRTPKPEPLNPKPYTGKMVGRRLLRVHRGSRLVRRRSCPLRRILLSCSPKIRETLG